MARQRSPPDPSPSPPAQSQPLTKRDVRRQRITDKLSGMFKAFDSNQQMHYQAQMRAVQVDMNLVLRADLHAAASSGEDGALLEDGGEEIRRMVEEAGVALPEDEAVQRDYWNLAGSRYGEFAREVNDCVEQRDADLVALHNNYHTSVAELDRLTQQKLHQAEQEHQALASTIRQRLVSSLNKKRQQLLRDKEQLDIAADNPLLLHPDHFRINVPGSPSNGTANRKTRHLRHRAGSPAPGDLEGNGGKRKRKLAALEDEGNESPAPGGYKPLGPPPDALGGGRSPFKDARDKNAYTQFEAPAYSLERIFTEKELAMASDTARMATFKHFNQPQEQEKAGSNGNGTAVPSIDGELADAAAPTTENEEAAATTEAGADGTPPPSRPAVAAPEMERSSSHQVLTRNHVRNNPFDALTQLASLASERNDRGVATKDLFAPVVPTHHAVMRSEKSGAPTPSGVSGLEAEADFRMIKSLAGNASAANGGGGRGKDEDEEMRDVGDEEGEEQETSTGLRKKLLDQALSKQSVASPYRITLLESGPAQVGKGVERLAATGFAPMNTFLEQQKSKAMVNPTSGAAMLGSAAAAAAGGGASPGGAAAGPSAGSAMAAALRGAYAPAAGAEPMSRTTSAGGYSEAEGPGVGTRGRGRGRLV